MEGNQNDKRIMEQSETGEAECNRKETSNVEPGVTDSGRASEAFDYFDDVKVELPCFSCKPYYC